MSTTKLRTSLRTWRIKHSIRKSLLASAERDLANARRRDLHPRQPLVSLVAKRKKQVNEAVGTIARRERQLAKRGVLQKRHYNGKPRNVNKAVRKCIGRAVYANLVVTSTTGGGHASTSYHFVRLPFFKLGRAVDLAGLGTEAEIAFQRSELRRGTGKYNELFGPDNSACIKDGRRITLAEGTFLEDQHDTHVHVAPRS